MFHNHVLLADSPRRLVQWVGVVGSNFFDKAIHSSCINPVNGKKARQHNGTQCSSQNTVASCPNVQQLQTPGLQTTLLLNTNTKHALQLQVDQKHVRKRRQLHTAEPNAASHIRCGFICYRQHPRLHAALPVDLQRPALVVGCSSLLSCP